MDEEQGTTGAMDEPRPITVEKPPATPSRFSLFLRGILRWAAGLVVVFGLGVAALGRERVIIGEAERVAS